jgi:hypothetical protein
MVHWWVLVHTSNRGVSSSKAVASCHANKLKKENLVSLLAWIWRLEQVAENSGA